MLVKDLVYYIMIEGEVQYDWVFPSEGEAIDFAEENEMIDYSIIEWDVE